MIVWIDGAFDSGKTTLVAELHRQWPEALVFDAEQIGRCAVARALLPRDTLVLDGRRPVAELAAEVLAVRPRAAEGARRRPA
jgi:hypothetical protein